MVDDPLPLAQEMALAHAGQRVRPVLAAFFALDQRLGHFVSHVKEPILTQMRIAWWRDQLRKEPGERSQGDPILDALSNVWCGEETALITLVDGWEGLLAEAPLPESAISDFIEGRSACFAAVARLSGRLQSACAAKQTGATWALADLALRMSDPEERGFVLERAPDLAGTFSPLSYRLRSLTILGALGKRAIDSGADTLVSSRKDILTISRIGLFGR